MVNMSIITDACLVREITEKADMTNNFYAQLNFNIQQRAQKEFSNTGELAITTILDKNEVDNILSQYENEGYKVVAEYKNSSDYSWRYDDINYRTMLVINISWPNKIKKRKNKSDVDERVLKFDEISKYIDERRNLNKLREFINSQILKNANKGYITTTITEDDFIKFNCDIEKMENIKDELKRLDYNAEIYDNKLEINWDIIEGAEC